MAKIPSTMISPRMQQRQRRAQQQAARRHANNLLLINGLANQHVRPIEAGKLEKLSKSLQHQLNLQDHHAVQNAKKLWKAVDASDRRLAIKKASDLQVKALALVWKVHDFIASSESSLRIHLPRIAERAGIKSFTAKFDPLIAVYRATIECDDQRVPRRAAQAIRWLQHEGVQYNGIFAYREKHGGDVNDWARKEQARKKKERVGNAGIANSKTVTAAKPLPKLHRWKAKSARPKSANA